MSFMDVFKKNEKPIEQFIAEITPMFAMMGLIDHAEIIGISHHELMEAMEKPTNKLEKENADNLVKLIEKINEMISDEELKKKITSKIIFFKDYGKLMIYDNGNKFEAKYVTNESVIYNFNLVINKDNIKYDFSDNMDKINLCGEYRLLESGESIIGYKDIKKNIYKIDDNTDYYDVRENKKCLKFDNNGIQVYQYDNKRFDNFNLNKKNGEKKLREPSPFENKTETCYSFRSPNNSIILKDIIEYDYESENKKWGHNNYMIGRNVNPEDKRLPEGGRFTWFDDELYAKYIKGEITINDIYDNLGDSYQKKLKK
jgi:hypothetical protein